MARHPRGIDPRLVDKHMRVVLPRAVAELLEVRQGDYVAFSVIGGEVRMRKVRLTLE